MGQHRTRFGWRVRVKVRGREYSKRFPPDAKPEDMDAWERHTLADAERDRLPTAPPGSFAADAAKYLEAVKAMPTYDDRSRDIGLWVAEFGTLPRASITAVQIRTVRDRWLTTGPRLVQQWVPNLITGRKDRIFVPVDEPVSASTVNNRLRALENLWTVIAPKDDNPVRAVPEVPEPTYPPRAIPIPLVRRIFAAMRPSAAKARLEVYAWAGVPPTSLSRMDPATLDLHGARLWLPGRQKGQGTDGRWVPLLPEGVRAFRQVVQWDAWTQPDKSRMRRTFKLACRKVQAELKAEGVTVDLSKASPHWLRHTYGTLVYAETGDFKAVEGLLDVSHKTAARYAAGAVDPRLQAAVDRLAKSLQKRAKVPPKGATQGATSQKHTGKRR